MNYLIKTTATALALALLTACTTTDPYTGEGRISRTAEGTGVGAAAGAIAGALFAKATNSDTKRGALTGAGIGALTGAAIGHYQDRQEAMLRQRLQNTGVSVTRKGNKIILNMPYDITFATDSANIKADFYAVLSSVALVLNEFNQTEVNVLGHTDSDGTEAHNLQLSQRRAINVAEYLIQQGNHKNRFYVKGMGETRPIDTNETAAGKARNRRVEVEINPIT